MNDAEKRRQRLLNETRARYRDDGYYPAVHPRYHASYSRLYEEDTQEGGTLGIRAFICFLLFSAFVAMDYQGKEILHVDSDRISQEISTDIDVAEVWKNL